MRRLIWGLAAVALVVAGCGGGKYASPKATMETMYAAAKAGDKDAVMACYCDDSREKIEEMRKLAEEFAKANPAMADMVNPDKQTQQMMDESKTAAVEYGEEAIDGDTATLVVTTNGRKDTMSFVREGGRWKIKLPMTDEQLQQMKQGLERMKNMPKGVMEGLKGLGEKMRKGTE